jgi:hypothetical protein
MTVRRASFFGLVGLVFAVWIVAVGCNLDGTGYGEIGGLCTISAHCDDDNACTVDTCDTETNVCAHQPLSGDYPDGVTGNCKILRCNSGDPETFDDDTDRDDGNDCTDDSCDNGEATHTPLNGTACSFQGGFGTCNGEGSCVAECGYLGDGGAEVGCGAPPNACTLLYCDKAKGVCVTEELDGIPVPGQETPGECGGSYCVDGVPTPQFPNEGTACELSTGGAGVCSGGNCIACVTDADCDDGIPESPCHDWVCMAGVCMNTTEPDGPLASQEIGNCEILLCTGGGFYVEQVDPSDVKNDGKECTNDICANGFPTSVPKPQGTKCGMAVTQVCNDMGECVGCNTDVDCLGGTECLTPKCNTADQKCFLDPEPAGKVITMQSPEDCRDNVCDANGNITTAFNPADPKNDNLDCTVDTCVAMNDTSHLPAAYGSTCDDGGGVVCDGAARCVGKPCSVAAECPTGAFCVDGVCCDNQCTTGCNACSAAKKGAGPNGLCGVVMAGDPDSDCAGNSSCNNGMCQPLPVGAACLNVAGECLSTFCVDGFCCGAACNGTCVQCNAMPGMCTPIAGGQDPANECAAGACDGTGVCRKDNGQTCAAGTDCLSNFCVDGVCCNAVCGALCQACNVTGSVGTCANVPNNGDPANECVNGACNGAGQCKLDVGQPCTTGGDCLNNTCVDGFCCNTACAATCQGCSMAKTGAANGTCANITANTDPENECAGTTTCNGSGMCNKLPNGSSCTLAGECSSNLCVDGVCCGTACGGTCQACNVAGNLGTCTPIPSGTDPSNECNGNGGNDVCNGSGACKEINGTGCAAGSECLTNLCVDGRCCNNSCSGTCEACNVAGSLGTCTPIVTGQDPANECTGATNCNGAGACTKLPNGAACMLAGECNSNVCVDGVCCGTACGGTCQSCNIAGSVGTCTNIASGTDPTNECTGNSGADVCNGAGACKEINGTGCSANSECLSGFCVDDVCCENVCSGTCQACSMAKTGMTNGVCTNVPPNTDPNMDCPGAQVCSMAGVCVGLAIGQMCSVNADCADMQCIDGFCCDGACGGTCEACNVAGSAGTCTPFLSGTDPADECGGNSGADVCNGMSACKEINGTACTLAGECLSGNCVDGVCCDAACGGLCQACSAAKQGQGVDGVCGNIKNGDDPDNECTGATTCNGMGACTM